MHQGSAAACFGLVSAPIQILPSCGTGGAEGWHPGLLGASLGEWQMPLNQPKVMIPDTPGADLHPWELSGGGEGCSADFWECALRSP